MKVSGQKLSSEKPRQTFTLTVGEHSFECAQLDGDVLYDFPYVCPVLPDEPTGQMSHAQLHAAKQTQEVLLGAYLHAQLLSTCPDVELEPPFPGRPNKRVMPSNADFKKWDDLLWQWVEDFKLLGGSETSLATVYRLFVGSMGNAMRSLTAMQSTTEASDTTS